MQPTPIAIADSKEHTTSEDAGAVECILFKLGISPTLVGKEREIEKGRLRQEFWDVHKLFQIRGNDHNKGHI